LDWICNRFALFAKDFNGNLAPGSSEPVSMPKSSTLPSLSVRIDLDAEGRIGPGKILLLEKINACGSISAAGRAMDMSYKRAWDLVDEINRICGHAAVARQTGGKNGGGAILTPFGVSLVARYRKIERAAASAVRKELIALRTDIGRPRKSSRD
jgi:molybdate transport system regulatory protein